MPAPHCLDMKQFERIRFAFFETVVGFMINAAGSAAREGLSKSGGILFIHASLCCE